MDQEVDREKAWNEVVERYQDRARRYKQFAANVPAMLAAVDLLRAERALQAAVPLVSHDVLRLSLTGIENDIWVVSKGGRRYEVSMGGYSPIRLIGKKRTVDFDSLTETVTEYLQKLRSGEY
jgi:hypothetical protein